MFEREFIVGPGETFAIVSPSARVLMWVDHNGAVWKVPTIKGRLKFKIPSHRALRDFVIWRDKVCQWCGSSDDLLADHKTSIRNGGDHTPGNLQALCSRCNARKSGLVDAKGKAVA